MEALAHQMRGATIMFFIFLCVLTYKDRKQNRMMQVLFFTFLCLAVGFLKDSIFLSRAMYGNPFIDNMVGIFDVSVMLVVCNFFLEAVRPESTKKPSVWIYPAAEMSGFNSVSTFNRYFRSVMGITPKEYYKKCMNRKRTDSNNK